MSSWLEVKQQAQGWITQCFDSYLFEPIFCYSRFAPFLVLGLFANALYRNALNLHDESLQTMCFMSRRHSMEVDRMSGKEGTTWQKQPNMLSTWSIPSLLSFVKFPVLHDGCISLICCFKVARGAFSSGARMGGFLQDYIHVIRATFVVCLAQSDDSWG